MTEQEIQNYAKTLYDKHFAEGLMYQLPLPLAHIILAIKDDPKKIQAVQDCIALYQEVPPDA